MNLQILSSPNPINIGIPGKFEQYGLNSSPFQLTGRSVELVGPTSNFPGQQYPLPHTFHGSTCKENMMPALIMLLAETAC
ncbi:hypothetical protein CDL15_Pgr000009 [Punica granatum]|uniref:Uncharacterized protein n=1 Tax=Punica granatum TaxID=22663 RepID=A0A218VQJ2_PUNGR|nr:hypothetical protein CDL15_Pgr000009 [Punica granatum]